MGYAGVYANWQDNQRVRGSNLARAGHCTLPRRGVLLPRRLHADVPHHEARRVTGSLHGHAQRVGHRFLRAQRPPFGPRRRPRRLAQVRAGRLLGRPVAGALVRGRGYPARLPQGRRGAVEPRRAPRLPHGQPGPPGARGPAPAAPAAAPGSPATAPPPARARPAPGLAARGGRAPWRLRGGCRSPAPGSGVLAVCSVRADFLAVPP